MAPVVLLLVLLREPVEPDVLHLVGQGPGPLVELPHVLIVVPAAQFLWWSVGAIGQHPLGQAEGDRTDVVQGVAKCLHSQVLCVRLARVRVQQQRQLGEEREVHHTE